MSEVKLSSLKKAMARQMTANWEIPQFQLYTAVDCTRLIQYRSALEFKASYTTLLGKVLAETMKEFPLMNSSWDDGSKILVHENINLGIAVDTPRGLLVPVIPDAGNKSLAQLHEAMEAIKEKAVKGIFTYEDLTGATFIISNLGMFNITHFSAIVNSPNAAILSVGKMTDQPKWDGSAFKPVKTINLGISLDHRVIDGAAAARFLTSLAAKLENIDGN